MRNAAYEQRKQVLIEEITAAFDGVAREDGVTLHEADVIDDYGSLEERVEARKKDTESRWQDVPDEDIRWGDFIFSFLDAKGFRYYLPAYMVWCLRYMDSDDPAIASNTLQFLLYHLQGGEGRLFEDRFRLLTTRQAKAVTQFLVLVVEREVEINIEFGGYDLERVKKGLLAEEERAALKQFLLRKMKTSEAAQALAGYWSQFL